MWGGTSVSTCFRRRRRHTIVIVLTGNRYRLTDNKAGRIPQGLEVGVRSVNIHSKKSTSVHEYERDRTRLVLMHAYTIQYHTFTPLACACSSDPLEPD